VGGNGRLPNCLTAVCTHHPTGKKAQKFGSSVGESKRLAKLLYASLVTEKIPFTFEKFTPDPLVSG
jgi:hypothetical protein